MSMRVVVIQNGALKDASAIALRDEYVKRFRRFGKLLIVEQDPRGEQPLWPASSRYKVALDERGKQYGSVEFAERLAEWTMRHGEVAFLIGGAYGHDAPSLAAADARMSLGPMTLPHQLAHVVLIEQIYRAATIRAKLPYHHA
jgi:23S rRNA (pseudouridine1915-N3)-methyltransferase